jgi:hypothetical protein
MLSERGWRKSMLPPETAHFIAAATTPTGEIDTLNVVILSPSTFEPSKQRLPISHRIWQQVQAAAEFYLGVGAHLIALSP